MNANWQDVPELQSERQVKPMLNQPVPQPAQVEVANDGQSLSALAPPSGHVSLVEGKYEIKEVSDSSDNVKRKKGLDV